MIHLDHRIVRGIIRRIAVGRHSTQPREQHHDEDEHAHAENDQNRVSFVQRARGVSPARRRSRDQVPPSEEPLDGRFPLVLVLVVIEGKVLGIVVRLEDSPGGVGHRRCGLHIDDRVGWARFLIGRVHVVRSGIGRGGTGSRCRRRVVLVHGRLSALQLLAVASLFRLVFVLKIQL